MGSVLVPGKTMSVEVQTLLYGDPIVVKTKDGLVPMAFYTFGEKLYRWVPSLSVDGSEDFSRMRLVEVSEPKPIEICPHLKLLEPMR